jgi:hypothetical protein
MQILIVMVATLISCQAFGLETIPSDQAEPFAFADFTWLNGNTRQKTSLIDNKYFTGAVIVDTNYIYSFNHPKDHTLDGATSAGRTNEFHVQQFGVGGDFHYENVRARLMTQFGMYSTMTPRNDQSPGRGQWNLADAYRYTSEAYGGYHWNTWNGINVDIGVFMSYIGLFSYYNFDNWAYQASYVSANTPWFFNGVRIQTFPTDKLKLEYWLINGWQSYGMFNEMPGFGFQVLYRPNADNSFVSNGYYGYDTQNSPGRWRIHSDSSIQHKYIDAPSAFLSKAAFSLTGDFGCESGGQDPNKVSCLRGDSREPSQYFLGIMGYNRFWFDHDHYALTIGGGAINNPGRYLVLIPPVQGAQTGPNQAASALNTSSAFPQGGNGYPFHAWDYTIGFDYMPSQFITWRIEFNHRQADVPYFAGPGGMTSQDGWNTNSQSAGWKPDLVSSENRFNASMMVRL